MIVHGSRLSPFVRKVLMLFEEKGIAYEQKDLVPVPKTPELLAKNPLGLVPILEHDATHIPDSSVIGLYVERLHPETPVYPADPKAFARALFIEEFADTKVAGAAGTVFFERVVKPNALGQETDEERVDNAIRDELPPIFDVLEDMLGEGDTTVLPAFSIADAALAGPLGSLALAGHEIDDGRWPRLAAYASALLARPSYQKAAQG